MTGPRTAPAVEGDALAGMLAPDYGRDSLDRVLPAALAAVGVETDGGDAARERFGLPVVQRVCVVLVDGLGLELVRERAGHARFLRSRLHATRALTTGYPSTTATSLGSFGTGRPPGATGLLGYTVRNPVTGRLANLVSWTGLDPAPAWQREPALLGVAAAAGVAVSSVGPARFAGSGLTLAVLGGGRYVPAESLDARVDAAVDALRAPGRSLVYLYWGDVDKAGHHHGWRSAEWADALTELDAGLAALARRLPAGTLMLVTADHGQVDVDHDLLVDVATTPALAAGVALVAGEPRATYVHLEDPGDAAAARERWQDVLGDLAVVRTGEEAVAAGWFGPVAEHVRPIVGDLVVAARGVAGVVDTRTQTAESVRLRGMHGSLTSGEMLVPLVVVA